ncbi:BRCA1-associated protein [Trypanosoma theileri]|uniref:BRCA1-associated protein n=1 Tax=Trypanosoma theileri TaxID=67003 RepID=A0A1X0P2Q1_9TRYP|nr:BRCA1-associated protein [Trypanosoma theileri]ORC91207.1 BRCA1-associated protein [Trypanosoma theileri]
MHSAEDSIVVVSFDCDRSVVVGLSCERTEPTRWLLVHGIPIDVGLSQSLQTLDSCERRRSQAAAAVASVSLSSSTSSSSFLSNKAGHSLKSEATGSSVWSNGNEECIRVVRVGYIPDEDRCYCLLLQYATSSDAEHVREHLLHSDFTGNKETLSEYVQPLGKVMTLRYSNETGSVKNVYDNTTEEISLEELCSVVRERLGCTQTQSENSSSCTRRISDKQEGSRLNCFADALVPTGDFCSICQEEIASGKPFIVTLCNHVFHLQCLGKHLEGVGPLCPLCRFSMASLELKCQGCGTHQDLWTCLVCGWVGCGQGYRSDHLQHFESTGHSCVMQNGTSRIWNHRAKTFLHHQLAIELGYEDDAKARQAAAAESSVSHHFNKEEENVTASSYWRSRWWWDEKDEEAALDLNAEYVREYYMKEMVKLMDEQMEYYEKRYGGTEMEPSTSSSSLSTSASASASSSSSSLAILLRKLLVAEQRQRRRIISEYVTDMRRIMLHDQMLFNRFVKYEATRNQSLREELLLLSHATQNLNDRVPIVKSNIEKATRRGSREMAVREEELKKLQEKLESLLKSLE